MDILNKVVTVHWKYPCQQPKKYSLRVKKLLKRNSFIRSSFSLKFSSGLRRKQFWQPCRKTLTKEPQTIGKHPIMIKTIDFPKKSSSQGSHRHAGRCFEKLGEKISLKGEKLFAQCPQMIKKTSSLKIFLWTLG